MLRYPIHANLRHRLNDGRLFWWLSLSPTTGGRFWYDIVGHRHGVVAGGALWRGTAQPGGREALYFPGDVSSSDAGLPSGTAGRTIAFWCNTASNLTTQPIFFYGTNSSQQKVWVGINASDQWEISQNGSTLVGPAVNQLEWYRIVVTFTAPNTWTLFINGRANTSATMTTNTVLGGSVIVGSDGTDFFNGWANDVSVWSRVLSNAEIAEDYLESSAGYPNALLYRRVPPLAEEFPIFDYEGGGTVETFGEADVDVVYIFENEFEWALRTDLTIGQNFSWNLGTPRLHWYRVIGRCKIADCDNTRLRAPCPGGTQYIQNVLAHTPDEVCAYLKSINWYWPILSIDRFSRPAENEFVVDPAACNEIEPVEFCNEPECLELCLFADGLIGGGMDATQSVEVAELSVLSLPKKIKTPRPETVMALLDTYAVSGGMHAVVEAEYNQFAGRQDEIEIAARVEGCSGCPSMPLTLALANDIARANVFKEFCVRNSVAFPDPLTLRYSRVSGAWRTGLHYEGIEGGWRFVFEWSCTDDFGGQETGNPVWKFLMLATRLAEQKYVTRLVLSFDPTNYCRGTDFKFGFTVNVRDLTVEADYEVFSEVKLLYDGAGLFASPDWRRRPGLTFRLAELAAVTPSTDVNLTPIFPTT